MTDRELQESVQNALGWEQSIHAAGIGVSVEGGVVTLLGEASCCSERATAERVALGVHGAKAVANDINVHRGEGQQCTDTLIAQAALSALKWSTMVPDEKVSIAVSHGWVTLSGTVDWECQRTVATNVIRDLAGVRGVTDVILIEPHVSVMDVKSKIAAALKRSDEVDASCINVAVADGKVMLSGNVHSWFSRNEARKAAWAAPGVKEIDDRIAVVPQRSGCDPAQHRS